MAIVRPSAGSQATEPRWRQLADLIRSIPAQARLALGVDGVAWATAAGIVGLICCAVSFAQVALSLHATEVEHRQQNAAEVLALDHATRKLLRTVHLMSYGERQPAEVQVPLQNAWPQFQSALATVCERLDDGAVRAARMRRACIAGTAMRDILAPEIEAFDPPNRLINPSEIGKVISLVGNFNNLSTGVAHDANALVGRMVENYRTALFVLTLSTAGFAGAGLILILLVGRASMRHVEQLRQATAAAREASEARDMLQETVDALPAGVVLYDQQERLVMFNTAAVAASPVLKRPNIIGITYEELAHETGKLGRELGAPLVSTPDEWIERFRSKGARRIRQSVDGRWFEWSEKLTASGRTVALRVDVTELKARELELEHAHANYQSLVDSMSDMVYALDPKGVFTFVSAASGQLLGVPAAQLVGVRFADFVVTEDMDRANASARAHLQSSDKGVHQLQLRMKRADGTIRHFEFRYHRPPLPDDRNVAAVGVMHDISERVELTQRLDAEMARLRSIVESSGALIVLVDRTLGVVMINSEFTAVTGLTTEDAVGHPLDQIVDWPLEAAAFGDWLSGCSGLDLAKPTRFTTRMRDRQGRQRLIAVTATPVADERGWVSKIVFLGVDDTERREVEEALFDTERLATVGEMAATVAHEVAQPLQVIGVACASVQDELADTATRGSAPDREFLAMKIDRIQDQVDRAGRIVGGLRAFVRGTSQEVPVRFDPAVAVQGAVNFTRHAMRAAKVALSVSVADDLPTLVGHVGKLEQVLVNLINNACDAGGREAGIAASAPYLEGRRFLRIVLEDDGPGIAADVLPRLFESFVTTKPRGKGTGLGLRICRRIVEEMGGSISAGNRAERGACFEILLPAAPDVR